MSKKETRFPALCAGGHPLWGEVYDRRAKAHNELIEKLEEAGIDDSLMFELIGAVEDYERMSFEYVTGRPIKDFWVAYANQFPLLTMVGIKPEWLQKEQERIGQEVN